jgi:hypothetical protein
MLALLEMPKRRLQTRTPLSTRHFLPPLTSADRCSENIIIETIVISKLKFGDIQRHIFAADAMECADNAAFEDAPEAFDCVGVNRADHVTVRGVPDFLVRIVSQSIVDFAFVRRQQTDFVADHFTDESLGSFFADGIEDAGDNISLAADSADIGVLPRGPPPVPLCPPCLFIALPPM